MNRLTLHAFSTTFCQTMAATHINQPEFGAKNELTNYFDNAWKGGGVCFIFRYPVCPDLWLLTLLIWNFWSANTNTRVPWDQTWKSTRKIYHHASKNTREMKIKVDWWVDQLLVVETASWCWPWCDGLHRDVTAGRRRSFLFSWKGWGEIFLILYTEWSFYLLLIICSLCDVPCFFNSIVIAT